MIVTLRILVNVHPYTPVYKNKENSRMDPHSKDQLLFMYKSKYSLMVERRER